MGEIGKIYPALVLAYVVLHRVRYICIQIHVEYIELHAQPCFISPYSKTASFSVTTSFDTWTNTTWASQTICVNLTDMSSNDNPSTLKSYVDSATGAIQSGVASLTGNASDQVSSIPT